MSRAENKRMRDFPDVSVVKTALPIAGCSGLIRGQGTKNLQAAQHGLKVKC